MTRSRYGIAVRAATFATLGFALGAAATGPHAQSKPPAYYITQIELTGDAFAKNYGSKVGATLAPFGGRFLVRGAKAMHLEGDQPRSRNAVIQFDNIDKAHAWYNSPAYQELRPIRQQLAKTNSYLVEGPAQ
jgi:uncharacterized protein (DUF1330 family)